MPLVAFDLAPHAATLGDPALFFVDEHAHAFRVVEHATGKVRFVLRPDGTLAPYRQAPDPDAPAVTATLDHQAGRASMSV